MQTISQILKTKFRAAFTELSLSNDIPILLVEATRPEFGDFQVNGVMGAAKALKTNPRELANKVINKLDLSGIANKVEIAGPGFINITLDDKFLAAYLTRLSPNNHYGARVGGRNVETVVIDLSSPNLAKEMHVGHLRSSVIGDAIARIYEYLGDKVIRQNHVGDWGTQFGMLIAYLISLPESDKKYKIADLEQCYREAKLKFDSDTQFADLARKYVVTLQNWQNLGDEGRQVYKYWQEFNHESLKHCQAAYDKLNIKLTSDNVRGESIYNDDLPNIVKTLEDKKLLIISQGAKCVFFTDDEIAGGTETPFIVQKQDGGYLYSTTDLAALNYRVHTLHADKIIYVVDNRQAFHFRQLFILGKKAGFALPNTELTHSGFGTMMNEDGRPFKTRDGGTVKLTDLIDEAISRALVIVNERNADWTDADKTKLASMIAISAIKYADLSKHRTSDYIFSFDKMLAFDGNTAPYLLYAYTRIQSILRKAIVNGQDIATQTLKLKGTNEQQQCEPEVGKMHNHATEQNLEFSADTINIVITTTPEHKLALHLAKFADTLQMATAECHPHYVCQYLYSLAGLFMQFYELCPILKADTKEQQQSRLALATVTAKILHDGLSVLGIETVDRM
jgi:arginyl-tRNA synthetase